MPPEDTEQPPPPDPGTPGSGGADGEPPNQPSRPHDPTAFDILYTQIVDVRRILDELVQQAEAERLRKRNEYVPVRASDLMRGFQAAVARANRAVQAGDLDTEGIADMAIKDLRVSLSAPVIDAGHAEDPTLMLPNIKSVDEESARISLEFTVVTVPTKVQT